MGLSKYANMCVNILSIALFFIIIFVYFARSGDHFHYSANPDFLSYYQNSVYWSAGDYNLAISGYFGPLYSWMLACFDLDVANAAALGRSVLIFCGLLFVLSAQFVFRVLDIQRWYLLLANCLIVPITAYWCMSVLTPDLLFSALVATGFGLIFLSLKKSSVRLSLVAGLFFGVSYLAKTPGLLFGFGAAAFFPCLAWFTNETRGRLSAQLTASALVGLAVVSLPWILVLSLHYGALTWTTAGSRSFNVASGAQHVNFTHFHAPKAGRISSWEDPTEFVPQQMAQSQKPSISLVDRGKRWAQNLIIFMSYAGSQYWLGLLLAAFLAITQNSQKRFVFVHAPWRCAIFVTAINALPYVLSYAKSERYYLISIPFLIGALVKVFGPKGASDETSSMQVQSASGVGISNSLLRLSATVMFVLLSFTVTVHRMALDAPRDGYKTNWVFKDAADLSQLLKNTVETGGVAEIGKRPQLGFWLAFHLQVPHAGIEEAVTNVSALKPLNVNVLVSSVPVNEDALADNWLRFDPTQHGLSTSDDFIVWLRRDRISKLK